MVKLLFICKDNIARSPTAEWLMTGEKGYEAESCGVGFSPLKRCTISQLEQADRIFTFDNTLARIIRKSIHKQDRPRLPRVEVLKIAKSNSPIGWEACDRRLIQEIKKQLDKKGIYSSKISGISGRTNFNSACQEWHEKYIDKRFSERKFSKHKDELW